jgi:CO/xanthine dehydrogenase FAD-binding subunit
MRLWNHYHVAQSIQEALERLASAPTPARLIAGGTDMLLDLEQGRCPPVDTLVDITQVPELTCLEIRQDHLFVGAAVPLSRLVAEPLLRSQAQALIEACGLIGGPQVRNVATLGGNVAHALPAADGTIALLALGAEAEIASLSGRRICPVEQLFIGPGRAALEPAGDLVVGFYLPLMGPGEGSAFRRVMRPQGVALPILNMAIWLRRAGEEIADLRLAVGPSGPVPRRARAAEAALRGRRMIPETLVAAQAALLAETSFRTSPQRATREYRRQLAGGLLREVVAAGWERTLSEVPCI